MQHKVSRRTPWSVKQHPCADKAKQPTHSEHSDEKYALCDSVAAMIYFSKQHMRKEVILSQHLQMFNTV